MGEIFKAKEKFKHTISIEGHVIRKQDVSFCFNFYDPDNYHINSFVKTIHFVGFHNQKLNNGNILFLHLNHKNDVFVIQNKKIIELFSQGINLYTTHNGLIILWNEKNFCTTLDMQKFCFYPKMKSFFKDCIICRIQKDEFNDFLIFKNRKKKFPEVYKINSTVTLLGDAPIGVSFLEYISDD